MRNYLLALLVSLGSTLLMLPLQGRVDLASIALLYVLGVVVIGSRYGRGPALATALGSSLCYAHVFVPPLFSLAILASGHLLAILVMLGVALLIGHLTAALKTQAEQVEARERQARALYELARCLSAASTSAEIEEEVRYFLERTLQARNSRILAEGGSGRLAPPLTPELLHSAFEGGQLKLVGSGLVLVPMATCARPRWLLACWLPAGNKVGPATRELLKTAALVVTVALQRMHFAEVAQDTEVRRAAEALRNSILSALSHDLRTPLTVMVGLAETLALGKASAERQRSMLVALRNQALFINQQVTNLLDMARLRSGSIELNEAWQPVEDVIGSTLRLVKAHWKDREITLDIPPDLPPLYFDAVLIERLLWNLLENAIKFSPADTPVELVVRQAGDWVEVIVCDWGPGLPPEGVEDLFSMFRRGREESNIPGVGLGLAIARGFAGVHGGQVLAENRMGGGACFRLRLPAGSPPVLGELEESL